MVCGSVVSLDIMVTPVCDHGLDQCQVTCPASINECGDNFIRQCYWGDLLMRPNKCLSESASSLAP